MIGIKGVGMTMLAQFLSHQGHKISGSDIKDVFLTDKVLKDVNIKVKTPFNIKNIPKDIDLVIHSSAFTKENNPELKYLLLNKDKYEKVEILNYAQALGSLFNTHKGLAVCGSHGKTTVSAWLGYVLDRAGKSPNVLVGSSVPQFKGSALMGQSKLFVAEVDEYQNKLAYFNPHGVILNNIDFDHPDYFRDEKDYLKVFIDFIKRVPKSGFLIINNDDKQAEKIKKVCSGQVITYAVAKESAATKTVNYLAYDIELKRGYQYFKVNNLGEFRIKLWGRHNIYNALAVIASARELRVSLTKIKKYLGDFQGTSRRCQVLGEYKQALIIDDYAHHPTEIKTTISGVKEHYKKRKLKVVFHPHTFTRTKALFSDFSKSFDLADELIILDIYGSAREKQGGVSSRDLVKEIKKHNQKKNIKQGVINIKDISQAVSYLQKNTKKNDLILLMGAGDVFRVGEKLLNKKT